MTTGCKVTRRVSSSASLKEAGSNSRRSSESQRRRGGGGPQTKRGIRKRCRIRAGWRHEWIPRTELTSSSVLAIRQIVRGPFSSPRLVSASPYVLVSSYCKNEHPEARESAARCPRIKRGIPDPWAEYLAYRGFCSKDDQRTVRRDLELGCKNVYVTAKVWKDLRLPLGQGIPDPWKIPVASKKWCYEKGVEFYTEKLTSYDKRRYCGHCKRCTRISFHGGCHRVGRASLDVDSSLLNTSPQQETRHEQVSQREIPRQCLNFVTEAAPNCSPQFQPAKKLQDSTAPCNSRYRNHLSEDLTGKFPIPKTQSSVITSFTSPRRAKRSNARRVERSKLQIADASREARVHQPEIFEAKFSRGTRTAKNLTNSGVQTSEVASVLDFVKPFVNQKFFTPDCATQTTPPRLTHELKKDITCYPCVCSYQEQFAVQNVACACESGDFRKKRVGFEREKLLCTETGLNPGKPNLNVTRLPCGCVHVSPCTGITRGFLGAENGHTHFGERDRVSSPRNDANRELRGRKYSEGYSVNKSYEPKSKIMSRMKRLLNRCKPRSRPQQKHGVGQNQTTQSDIYVNKIPDDGKFVCCQCSCPYLKIKNPSQETPAKSAPRKKGKCNCGRCVAKRERREKRRSVVKTATEEQAVSVGPKSCERPFRAEPDHRISIKCHNESCGMKHRSFDNDIPREGSEIVQLPKCKTIPKKEGSYSLSVPKDSLMTREVTEKVSTNVDSSEVWRYPPIFGASWYSSDSGENADVSETSRHTVKCTPMLGASLETALVTSCTFINRINHGVVLQCLKRQQRRPRREMQELDSEVVVNRSRNSPRRSGTWQTSAPTTGSEKLETIPNAIPLLDIKESEAKDSRKASPRMSDIPPLISPGSSYNDAETSETTSATNREKTRRESYGKRTNPRNEDSRKKLDGSTVDDSQVTLGTDSIHKITLSPSQRTRLGSPKIERVLDETESSTDVATDKLKIPDPSRERREFTNSTKSEDDCDSSENTCDRAKSFGYEPIITTIVSPRKISGNSSMTCVPENCTRRCRKAQVPRNTPTDGGSSENQSFPRDNQNAIVYRCDLPFTRVPRFEKSPNLNDEREKDENSTPARYTICSPGKVAENFDSNSTKERRENETSPQLAQGVRILVQNRVYQGGQKSSADNKCYLKYCSQQSSGPCIVSTSRKILRIQQPSCTNNEDRDDGVLGIGQSEFPVVRRAFSSSSNHKKPAALPGDVFSCISQYPLTKVQDNFNVG